MPTRCLFRHVCQSSYTGVFDKLQLHCLFLSTRCWFNTSWIAFPQALQEEINVSGSKIKVSYLSSRTAGYKSVLRISMTHPTIPFNLMKVHLMVAVEGRLFRKWFAAAPDLSYYFIWDKTDVYSQKVYRLSEAFGKWPQGLCLLLEAAKWQCQTLS